MPKSYVLAEVPEFSTLKGVYEPKGAAKELWSCKDPQVIIEGPSETGKTLAALHKLDALCWKYPGMQGMIVRKYYTTIPGSVMQTYQLKVVKLALDVSIVQNYELPRATEIGLYGGTRPEQLKYPNGSVIWICGMDHPEKALSQERDIIYVNQCEELSIAEWETLTTRCTGRAGNMPYPQIIGDCNPSAPTHWILAKARSGTVTLLHSKHKDNPILWDESQQKWLSQGVRTMKVLESLTGSRRARLLEGLWVIPEGSIYEQFDEEYNKIASFTPPTTWPRIVGVDPTGAYVGALWLAYDPVNYALHVYREYIQPYGITTGGHADNILDLARDETIWRYFGGGPSERQQRTDYLGWGLPLEAPTVTDVWAGIDRVQQLFKARALFVHDCCLGLLSELGTYRRVTDKNGNQTESIQDKNDYHLLDCLRYAVVGLLGPGEEEQSQLVYSPVKIGVEY